MTFEERAEELHRLDAFAVSLGLSDAEFVRIAQDAIAEGHAKGADPDSYLADIRRRIVERGDRHMRRTGSSFEAKTDLVEP